MNIGLHASFQTFIFFQAYNHKWNCLVISLDGKIPLEEGMETRSSIFAWGMDRGAWWAIVHKVTKSQAQPKLLSTHST